jgi:hypothetical protein
VVSIVVQTYRGSDSKDGLHLGSVLGPPEAQRTPLSRLGRRRTEPKEVSLLGLFTRPFCLTRLGVVDSLAGCALRDGNGEGDQNSLALSPEFGLPGAGAGSFG